MNCNFHETADKVCTNLAGAELAVDVDLLPDAVLQV